MAISLPIITKALGGLSVIGVGATTVYFGNDYLSNINSKYDKALINFLNKKDNDIVFSIKKGSEDFNASHLNFSDTETSFTVSIKVQIPQTTPNVFFSGSSASDETQLKEIKSLNEGSWEWECKITLEKKGSNTEIKEEYKNSIFQDDKKGLFGILKSKISDMTDTGGKLTKDEIRKIKSEFIGKCGSTRGFKKNKSYNSTLGNENKITTDVPKFTFINRTLDSSGKLIPEESDFGFWFKKEYYEKI